MTLLQILENNDKEVFQKYQKEDMIIGNYESNMNLPQKKAESVLMQRIRKMREGSPKWSASEKLRELREAISLIKKR